VGTNLVLAVNAFHILGSLLAIWAVVVTALGLRREDFPRSRGQAWLAGTTSVVLAVGTIGAAIITGALEEEEEGEAAGEPASEAAPAGGGRELRLAADPSGQLAFDKSALEAKAGAVTIAMRNASSIPHDVSLEGGGVDEKGKVVRQGGTSTVEAELKPGSYTFYCSVAGHRQGGMEGKLTVR
jgi:plastocyanin